MSKRSSPSTLGTTDQLSARRAVAAAHLPAITWLSSNHGQFTCPEGHPDCWVYLDGAVTLFCPGGKERRCYPELQRLASEIRDELAEAEAEGGAPKYVPTEEDRRRWAEKAARREQVRFHYNRTRPLVFKQRKSLADLRKSSPRIIDWPRADDWRVLLRSLFPHHHIIWIGERSETSRPECATNFRSVDDWLKRKPGRPAYGPLWSPAAFKAGIYHRRQKNVLFQMYFPVEGDQPLTLDEQATALLWLSKVYPLAAVTFSGRVSLHGLFLRPLRTSFEAWQNFMALLEALDFDLGNFRWAGTSRCPGFYREPDKPQMKVGAWQELVYFDPSVREKYQRNEL
jgi:hypothetical protein